MIFETCDNFMTTKKYRYLIKTFSKEKYKDTYAFHCVHAYMHSHIHNWLCRSQIEVFEKFLYILISTDDLTIH